MTIMTDQPGPGGPIRISEEDAVSGSREWMERGACRSFPILAVKGFDPWFGYADDARDGDGEVLKTSVIPREYRRMAMGYCLVCPVKQECLEYAMDNDIRHGIWGGKAPEDRTRLRRVRAEREESQ